MGSDTVVMNSHHLIDSAVIDLTYDQGDPSIDQCSSVNDFINHDLMIVVDEVFNEATNSGVIYRISSIELDLGHIPYADYKHEMPKRLREQLISSLAEIRHAHQTGKASNGEVIDQKSAEQNSLLYFLRKGYLPWHSRLSDTDTLEVLLKRAIDSNPGEFCTLLCSMPHRRVALERLVKQFSADTITYLLDALCLSHSQTAQQTAMELKVLMQCSGSLPFNAEALPEHALPDLYLQEQLASALLSNEMFTLHTHWSVLYSKHAELLKKALQHYGQQLKVRKNIAAGFSEMMLQDLLVLIEPLEHGFVTQVIEQAVLFQSNQKLNSSDQMQHKAEMWEFSLAYLLVQRGSLFNKKAYLGSLIKQMAASRSWSCSALIHSLIKNISAYSKASKLARDLLQFLTEQQDALKFNIESQEQNNAAQLESVYVHYESLSSTLSNSDFDGKFDKTALLADLNAVSQKTPWLLTRLYQELQANRYAWHRAIENLSVPLLHQLVQELVTATSEQGSSTSDFMTAVQSNAERFANQKAFFIHILNCLISNKLIDFDALASSKPFQANTSTKEHEKKQLADDQTNLHSQLVSALVSGEMSIIQTHWSVLYGDYAQLLKKTLQHYGQQLKIRKHIAVGFSEEILHDILRLIEPSEHSFVTQVIEQAALFLPNQKIESANQTKHKTEMWEFSLAYLLVERGS